MAEKGYAKPVLVTTDWASSGRLNFTSGLYAPRLSSALTRSTTTWGSRA